MAHKRSKSAASKDAAAVIIVVIIIIAVIIAAHFVQSPQNKYELEPSFLPNSSNYYHYNPQLPSDNPLFVFPNNTTAIYQNVLLNKNPVNSANTTIEMYALVEAFHNATQADAALNFKKNLILSLAEANTTNTTVFSTPAIGSMTFGFEEPFYLHSRRLYVVNFVYGSDYVRVGVYETLNSSSALPILLAQKYAAQIAG